MQAEINEEALEILHDIELKDWSRFGKIRQAREKELTSRLTTSAQESAITARKPLPGLMHLARSVFGNKANSFAKNASSVAYITG